MAERKQSANSEDKIKQILDIARTMDYTELFEAKNEIGRIYEQKAQDARTQVIEETKVKFEQLGLRFEDVMTSQQKRKRATGTPVAPKYRSPDGKEWSGRGATPKWIREYEETGGKRDDYLIKSE